MIKILNVFIGTVYYIVSFFILLMALFFLTCMNVFTIPVFLLVCMACKLIKIKIPRARLYGTMLYPSWRETAGVTFLGTVEKVCKRSTAKSNEKIRRKQWFYHPWEARFFW